MCKNYVLKARQTELVDILFCHISKKWVKVDNTWLQGITLHKVVSNTAKKRSVQHESILLNASVDLILMALNVTYAITAHMFRRMHFLHSST
jgi:hypothetical protein